MAPGRATARAAGRAAGQGSVISVPPPQRAPDRGQGAPGSRAASTPGRDWFGRPARTELSGVRGGAAPEAVAQLRAGWPGSGGLVEEARLTAGQGWGVGRGEARSTAGPDWGAGRGGSSTAGPGLGELVEEARWLESARRGSVGAVVGAAWPASSSALGRLPEPATSSVSLRDGPAVGGAGLAIGAECAGQQGPSGWLVDVPARAGLGPRKGGTAGRAAALGRSWGQGQARDAPVHAWAAPRRRPRTPARRAAWPLDGGSSGRPVHGRRWNVGRLSPDGLASRCRRGQLRDQPRYRGGRRQVWRAVRRQRGGARPVRSRQPRCRPRPVGLWCRPSTPAGALGRLGAGQPPRRGVGWRHPGREPAAEWWTGGSLPGLPMGAGHRVAVDRLWRIAAAGAIGMGLRTRERGCVVVGWLLLIAVRAEFSDRSADGVIVQISASSC